MKTTYKLFLSACMAMIGHSVLAQESAKAEVFTTPLPLGGEGLMYLIGIIVFVLLILVLVLWRISRHLKSYYKGEFNKEEVEYKYPWERLFQFRSVSTDKDVMMDHSYDGIVELDNPPPPWFMYLFYGTILFAAIYFVRYSVTGDGPTQLQEYTAELKSAEEVHEAYLSKAADLIDETNVVALSEKADIDAGATIYKEKCQVCHKDKGQGEVGPNLTDEYWIHGGDIKDVFKTIKYGVTEKGMQSWQKDLNPKMIQQVASFIMTLQGTNPEGAKAPQGEKYVPAGKEEAAPADSTLKS